MPDGEGSSPHTRDKFKSYTQGDEDAGIIPAYAGQISFSSFFPFRKEDHPRIRGTNKSQDSDEDEDPGSSPHTRDKFRTRMLTLGSSGIIPAYAGQIKGWFKSADDW